MTTKTIKLSSGDNVTLTTYLLDSSNEMPNMLKRRAILVCPGGAYSCCSDREAEPIAMAFLAQGYNAFVLRYSIGKGAAKFPKPLNDAEEALELIVKNADEWCVMKDKIAVIGFSAGGHLAAALSTMGSIRPNAAILGYPCILDSTENVLVEPVPSLEKEVDVKTPPTFIFSSSEDSCVPIENSIAYADALDKHKIPFELHVFQRGWHGFSLATSVVFAKKEDEIINKGVARWFKMCIDWLDYVLA